MDKSVVFHVYTSAGVFVRAWPDVATLPSYRWPINGGPSSMALTLPRVWGDAGEEGEVAGLQDIRLGNRVDIYVHDSESGPDGALVYSGSIESYDVSDPPASGVRVTLVPKTSRFSDNAFEDEVELVSYDPAAMMEYLVDNWLPGITWHPSNTNVGQTFSQKFKRQSIASAAETIRRLGGGKWFYHLNPDDSLTFAEWDLHSAQHVLNGNHFANVTYRRSKLGVKNMVRLYGKQLFDTDGTLIDRVYAEASNSDYSADNPRVLRVSMPRVDNVASAGRIARALLEDASEETVETEIEIPDNSVEGDRGYDIESLKPGQTLQLLNPKQIYDTPEYDAEAYYDSASYYGARYAGLVQLPLVIAEVDYGFTRARVKLTTRPAPVIEALVGVEDRLIMEGSA